MKRLQIVLVLAVIFIFLKPVAACSYYEYPSVCDAYGSAEAIFVGTVLKVVEVKNLKTLKLTDSPGGKERQVSVDGLKHFVKVERTFKGAPQTEILLATLNDSCSVVFSTGDKLLLYVSFDKEIGMWKLSTHRTAALELANDDLLFLGGLPKTLNRTRISGSLFNFDTKADPDLIKLTGIKVKIQSKTKTFEAATDENGVYEIYDLPVDSYAIMPEIPKGLELSSPNYQGFGKTITSFPTDKKPEEFYLKNAKCIGINFLFKPNKTDEKLK